MHTTTSELFKFPDGSGIALANGVVSGRNSKIYRGSPFPDLLVKDNGVNKTLLTAQKWLNEKQNCLGNGLEHIIKLMKLKILYLLNYPFFLFSLQFLPGLSVRKMFIFLKLTIRIVQVLKTIYLH